MKKLALVAGFFLAFSAGAVAQDVPVVEIFGGYALFHLTDTGPDSDDTVNMHGWDASATFNINNWAGFVADVGGIYKNEFDADLKIHSIMFGPQFSIRKGKVTPFARMLIGAAMARVNDSETGESYQSENDFALAFGGGVDVDITPGIAVRPAQFEYVGIKAGETGDFVNCFRYSAGIVFKLGKR